MTAMLQASDIWKSFGDHVVLKGVDLAVERGEVVAVLPFDLGQDGQQDVLGRLFLGGQDELASALQLAGDRHG